jgi:hypothetical protein
MVLNLGSNQHTRYCGSHIVADLRLYLLDPSRIPKISIPYASVTALAISSDSTAKEIIGQLASITEIARTV